MSDTSGGANNPKTVNIAIIHQHRLARYAFAAPGGSLLSGVRRFSSFGTLVGYKRSGELPGQGGGGGFPAVILIKSMIVKITIGRDNTKKSDQ